MRRPLAVGLLMVAMAAMVVSLGSTAYAQQSGYPPTLCATRSSVDLGTLPIGASVVVRVGGPWVPGSIVTLNFDNQAAGSKVVDPDGCVNVTITVNAVNSISIDDVVPGRCGDNTLLVTGAPAATAGAVSTATIRFSLDCARTVPASAAFSPSVSTSPFIPTTGGGLPTLGSPNALAQPPAQPAPQPAAATATTAPARVLGSVETNAPTSRGRAFTASTGANIAKAVIVALMLMALGAGLVVRSRRRHSSATNRP